MNRIDKKFKELRLKRKKAFIAYITAGDPSLADTGRIVPALERAGVDIIELGIPFSDPIADGPTIQAASQRALERGATLHNILQAVKRLRKKSDLPIVFMTYYNPVMRFGIKKFFASCKSCGVDGVIVPDLPVEEAGELKRSADRSGIATIFLAAPTSTPERLRQIIKTSEGFIYYVSLTGVTGARRKLPPEIAKNVKSIKRFTDKPVAVGFGVSDARQAEEAVRIADGVIIGSALVRIISAGRGYMPRLTRFAQALARTIHGT